MLRGGASPGVLPVRRRGRVVSGSTVAADMERLCFAARLAQGIDLSDAGVRGSSRSARFRFPVS